MRAQSWSSRAFAVMPLRSLALREGAAEACRRMIFKVGRQPDTLLLHYLEPALTLTGAHERVWLR